jgi:hypothetical protein
MKGKIESPSIAININNKLQILSFEEAKRLYEELQKIFGQSYMPMNYYSSSPVKENGNSIVANIGQIPAKSRSYKGIAFR